MKQILTVLFAVLTVCLLLGLLLMIGHPGTSAQIQAADVGVLDRFDRYMTNQISDALDGIVSVDKVYWLSDEDLVAPKPNADCYGQTEDPSTLTGLLKDAQKLLDGQSTLFTPETAILEGSTVYYYLDETILVVTWKQALDNSVYTFSEVRISDPSQFRRFLSGGQYASGVLYTTTEMAQSVNAVVASSGDYYSYRRHGIVVNGGHVFRSNGDFVESCFIDENGDLLFTYPGELVDEQTAQKFVDDHNIRFSLSFGPVLVLDGNPCAPSSYLLGEIGEEYPRAALCQMDKLHYVLVTVNMENPYYGSPRISTMADRLSQMGIPVAYALDGGQTAVIAMNNKLMNNVNYGSQRDVSDIIYFATAVPST